MNQILKQNYNIKQLYLILNINFNWFKKFIILLECDARLFQERKKHTHNTEIHIQYWQFLNTCTNKDMYQVCLLNIHVKVASVMILHGISFLWPFLKLKLTPKTLIDISIQNQTWSIVLYSCFTVTWNL